MQRRRPDSGRKPVRNPRPSQSREISLEILTEILEKGEYSHRVLRQALDKYQYLDKQDRAFITRLTEGVIERLLTIDAVLNECSSVPCVKMKPLIRTILRMSVYQILWMDRVPDRAVCSEAGKLADSRGLTGLKGFVNGVLRTISRRKGEFVFDRWEFKYSMPSWLIEMWKSRYGASVTEQMLAAFLEDQPTCVRCMSGRASRDEIQKSLEAQGVTVERSPLSDQVLFLSGYDYPESLEAFARGWIQVQDVSSVLVGAAACPKENDFVIDVCAAPGGKSLDIADRLHGSGRVLARDLSEEKTALIDENIQRIGLSNIVSEVWDARVFDPRYEEKADLVIADLPCSGLGIIGKKPDIKYGASADKIGQLAALQREILSVAARYVKPGGRLVYSTCTISRAENEDQREWFLAGHPFRPVPIEMAGAEVSGRDTLKDGYLQLLPGVDPCDGFFLSVFERERS